MPVGKGPGWVQFRFPRARLLRTRPVVLPYPTRIVAWPPEVVILALVIAEIVGGDALHYLGVICGGGEP